MGALDAGIFQIGPDISGGEAQKACLEQLRKIALDSGRPIMFGMLATRQGIDPNPWDFQTRFMDETVALGGRMYGQATTRSINAVFSLKSYLPFDVLPAWKEIRALPLAEQKARLRDPEVRARLVAAEAVMKPRERTLQGGGAATTDPRKPDYDNLFPMLTVNWDDPSIGELSRRHNKHPVEVIIDLALENENRMFVQPIVNERPADVLNLLKHPRTLATFSDSGAHVCQEMGSSLQTHLLSYWVRNKQQFTLEEAVRMLTFDNASAWELPDRGLIRTGYAADLVVFDEATVKPQLPTVETDLPGGARRLVQKADGIAATIVNGVVAIENGQATGNAGGQVLKGRLAA
jgi:N-acyl-D-aspartate/D-glutamate deacylase